MNTKKTALALLVTFLISNVLTTVWYMLTDEANFVPNRRAEINYGALMLNHLLFAAGLVYLFPFYYERFKQLKMGFMYGAIVAGIMFIPTGLVVRSIWTVEINTIFFLNTLAHLAIGGIMGLATALIYNYKNSKI